MSRGNSKETGLLDLKTTLRCEFVFFGGPRICEYEPFNIPKRTEKKGHKVPEKLI